MGSSSLGKSPQFLLAAGFTLIELLVVVAMVSILIVVVLGFLNPFEQFTKSNDAKRESDLTQIRTALDAYFNDTGCYPATLSFGVSFTSADGKTVYMKRVPQDPDCGRDPSKCYIYDTDTTSSCPQWNVLFGALRQKNVSTQTASSTTLCSLEVLDKTTQGGCLPDVYKTNGYNFCLTSGTVQCGNINIAPTAAPTMTSSPGCQKVYSCTSKTSQLPNGICNIVGTDNNGNGLGDYCGSPGCIGNACCLNNCNQ